jgi:ribosome-associated protein
MINTTEELKDFIVKCLEDKKADDILVIDLEKRTDLARYMIFASGRSTKNVGAIADYVSLEVKHNTDLTVNIEGLGKSEWVLLDAGDIIVHVFYPETRAHFKLEEMWNKRLK